MARDPVVLIPTQQKIFLRKGKWLPEEDQKLVAYISKYGIWNWNEMPKYAGLWRSGKSCRLRWMNYLQPGIKHGNITEEEEEIIIKWHKVLGNRWSAIAKKLPQRTDCEIKNYWNTHLRKLVQATTTTNSTSEAENHSSDASNHLEENHSNIQMQAPIGVVDDDPLVSSSTHESDSPFRIDDSYEAFQEILRSWEREIRRPMDTVSTFKH